MKETMLWIFAIVVIAVAASAEAGFEASQHEDETTSSHKTRSLPQIEKIAGTNWTTLTETLDVYNTRYLARNWIQGKYPIREECARDVTRYVEGLRKQELWALKADDASGRYTNGFFWGNSYFMGAATECEYIGKDYVRKGSNLRNGLALEETEELTAESRKKINTGFSATKLWSQSILDKSPFNFGFFTTTITINASISPVTRTIQMGVCLPFSCSAADVKVIFKLAASDTASKYSLIEKVRDQHQQYDIYSDPVFWILLGVSAVVLVLLAIGTTYDIHLSRKFCQEKNIMYDLERHAKLEQLGSVNGKVLNGKSDQDQDGIRASDTILLLYSVDFQGKVYLPVPASDVIINGTQVVNNNNDNEGTLRPATPEPQRLNVFEEFLLSFSIRANMRTICDNKVGGDTISTVHGLRAISMAWVILGHTCIVVFKYSDNMEYRKVVERKFLFQTITNGAFSVDTFFFMGGLLVSFLFFRSNAKGDLNKLTQGTRGFVANTLKFIGLLAYRFCRLTTPYMFVLGVVQITMKWFNANSIFEPPAADHENCPNYWWRNMLYINTLFPVDQMCMLWSWYVADDTQFYIVGAVILVLATNHFKIAAVALSGLLISSWITTGYIALVNNHMPSSDDPLALFDKIYDKPWTRLGPYLIGMSVGYFLFKTDCKVKLSKTTVVVGWLLSSACLLSLLYGLYDAELSPITAAAYSALSHSAWALGLAWIVIACSTGYGGYVNSILSASVLYPFSRVTYCAYLLHPLVIRITAMNMDAPFHLGKDTVLIIFLGQLVLSYILSFIVSLSFEAPVVSMLKILAPKKRKRIQ